MKEFHYATLPYAQYSLDLPVTDYHFFKHFDNFLRVKCFTNHDDAKNVFNEFITSRTPEFYANGINKLFLVGKNIF
ncbi:hypothetical protein Angca_004120, partial [Angiostrongylus cantonensis]